MTANRQGRTLAGKLGIKEGATIAVLNPPNDCHRTLGRLPKLVTVENALRKRLGFIHFFTKSKQELKYSLRGLKHSLAQDGVLWISWPKGSSKIETDLNENTVREIVLKSGLVDTKVIAVDEDWSGLKFVHRLKDRKRDLPARG